MASKPQVLRLRLMIQPQAYKNCVDQYLKHIFEEDSPMETIRRFQYNPIQMQSVQYSNLSALPV